MKNLIGFQGWIACSVMLAAIPGAGISQTRRVAVYDFSYNAVKGDVLQVYGSDKPVGAQVANRIIAKLVNNSKVQFDVIDRNQIDNLLKEQNQKFSDRFDPRDAPRLGRLLNVDAIITGSVDEMATQIKNNRVGIGAVGVGKVESVADVTVSVRVISTETGRIFIADQLNTHQTYELGKGGTYKGNGGENGSTMSHPGSIPADHALQQAGDQIAAKILARAEELPVRTGAAPPPPPKTVQSNNNAPATKSVPTPAPAHTAATTTAPSDDLAIGRVDGTKIYITAGANAGLKVNDYLEVRRVTGSMKAPDGSVIQTDEKVDTLVVTDVEDKFSVAQSTKGGATVIAKVGDRLKRMRTPVAAKAPAKAPGK